MKKIERQNKCLILNDLIGFGATRECYLHPDKPNRCVKILKNSKDKRILEREIKSYLRVRPFISDLVPIYENVLVNTNKGLGLVCELFRDDDEQLSKPISYYAKNNIIDDEMVSELYYFAYQLMEHDLYFYDFNLKNFVIQVKDGKKKLKYIDLKSYNNNKSWTFLRLEKIFAFLAKAIMQRRLKRCFKLLKIEI